MTPRPDMQLPSERSFGFLFAAVLAAAAAALAWFDHRGTALGVLGLALVFGVLAGLAPRALAVPNRLWFQFGALLHRLVSPLVLGIIFFLLIAPLAMLLRMAGRDALELKRSPRRRSYWKKRDPPGPPADSLDRQFQENALSFLAELWSFLRQRKKLWLLPVIIVLVVLGGLLVLAQGSVIAPFIYTLF